MSVRNYFLRYLIIIFLLSCFHMQLDAQVKHEVKLPLLELINPQIQPSYEMVTKNERFGFEFAAGIDFAKALLLTPIDTSVSTVSSFNQLERYEQRVFKSELAIKYYLFKIVDEKYLSFFAGPAIAYERFIRLDEDYIQKRNEQFVMNKFDNPVFVGKSEIRPGFKLGGKLILKKKLVIEIGGLFSVLIEEKDPGNFLRRSSYTEINPSIKIGYRFGDHPMAVVKE